MSSEEGIHLDNHNNTNNSTSPRHGNRKLKKNKPFIIRMANKMSFKFGWIEYFVLLFCLYSAFRILFFSSEGPETTDCPFPEHICKSSKLYLPYNKSCSIRLVESIPQNLTFNSSFTLQSTYDAWSDLINNAEKKIDMAVFYWALNGSDISSKKFNSSWEGEDIWSQLIDAGSTRNISLRIVQNAPTPEMSQLDSQVLVDEANAEVLSINFTSLIGAGVLHTKMWLVDDANVYIGSANMDWRSLTQVKELGIVLENCPAVARDASKIFGVYKSAATNSRIPSRWPFSMSADSSIEFPFNLTDQESNFFAFLSSSPPELNAKWRTNDIDAITYNIFSATKFVYVAVMDYYPIFLYTEQKKYYPCFDEALRKAAYENNVNVRVLASHWNHTRPEMIYWLKSLRDISHDNISIEAKLFVVPSYTDEQREIPFARVNHNKYMVTDKTAYIDTSNWSGDYFVNTGGVGISITPQEGSNANLRDDLQAVFERDWDSDYAHDLEDFTHDA